jgi:hypothetical protein
MLPWPKLPVAEAASFGSPVIRLTTGTATLAVASATGWHLFASSHGAYSLDNITLRDQLSPIAEDSTDASPPLSP